MRVAIVSDVHGNRRAFAAVLADLRQVAPDLVVHGGDLAYGGARPAEIVDQVRALGWPGVVGNTDEMLWAPKSLAEFAAATPKLAPLLAAIQEIIPPTLASIGEERLRWLEGLPDRYAGPGFGLVHASPGDLWRAPMPEASDDELRSTYASLGAQIVGIVGRELCSSEQNPTRDRARQRPPLHHSHGRQRPRLRARKTPSRRLRSAASGQRKNKMNTCCLMGGRFWALRCLSGAARYARLCVAKAAARPRATQVPTSLTSSRTRLRTEGLPCGSVSAGIARAAAQKDRPHGRPTGNLESFNGNAGNQVGAFAGFR